MTLMCACERTFVHSLPLPLSPHVLTHTRIHTTTQAVLSVFDGHGGNEVAEHCRESLHRHFAHQLSLQRASGEESDEDDSETPYDLPQIAEALRASFLCTDDELKGTEAGDYVGATAVVAVIGKGHIIIAHAGGCAVVCVSECARCC